VTGIGIEPVIDEAHLDVSDETGNLLTVATKGVDTLQTLKAEQAAIAHQSAA
jgi:hypothetical protein